MGRCGHCKGRIDPIGVPLEVNDETFEDIVANATVPVLVDFWAVWSTRCRAIAPDVQRVAAELAGKALVLKIDTDDNPDLSLRLGARSVPFFIVFTHGRRIGQLDGAVDQQRLTALVARAGKAA